MGFLAEFLRTMPIPRKSYFVDGDRALTLAMAHGSQVAIHIDHIRREKRVMVVVMIACPVMMSTVRSTLKAIKAPTPIVLLRDGRVSFGGTCVPAKKEVTQLLEDLYLIADAISHFYVLALKEQPSSTN